MCGVFGFIGNLDRSSAEKCLNNINHRGPDSFGLKFFDDAVLAHRRLSIIDLSKNGSQPMSYLDNRYWISYNGEIYNFNEIKKDLLDDNYKFYSDSDTEVILAAFVKWGEDCQNKFNGMWSFAIWDTLKKELFISRDRLGKKPFFYTFINNKFAFCSEMKGLYPLINSISPNSRIISNPSTYMFYESTAECVIEGIKRLPAGSCGWYKNDNLEIKKWWNTKSNLIDVPKSYEDQVMYFRELFLDSVKLRMRADVPIGTALSGGLDSSVTFASMAYIGNNSSYESNNSWQHAFVASFPGSDLDEVRYAKRVAEKYSISPNVIEINPIHEIENIYDYMYITNPIPFIQLYRSVKDKGIKVTLDGHGADELFGGYAFDIIFALFDCKFGSKAYSEVLDTYINLHGSSKQLKSGSSKKYLAIKWQLKKIIEKVERLKNKNNKLSFDYLNERLYESTHTSVLPTLLRNYDRYSMINGVEIRMPFLDHRILSSAFSIPWTSKIRNGFSKAIIRDALGDLIPKSIVNRKEKIGFNSPLTDWYKGPLKNFLLTLINEKSFSECSYIDAKYLKIKVKKALDSDNLNFQEATNLWSEITPYLWEQSLVRRFNI